MSVEVESLMARLRATTDCRGAQVITGWLRELKHSSRTKYCDEIEALRNRKGQNDSRT